MGESILRDKKNNSTILKNHYFPSSKNKINILVHISSKENLEKLLSGLSILPANFLVVGGKEELAIGNIGFTTKPKQDLLGGFDAVIADNDFESLSQYFSHALAPIVPENHYLKTILSEFDPSSPKESAGNAFLYQENNMWSLYYATIRYLENYKFPYDNKTLMNNVLGL